MPVDALTKLSAVPGAVLKAERVELQMCSPMYAKSMAKACSLLSSATEHVLYHCHSHFNVQVCYKRACVDLFVAILLPFCMMCEYDFQSNALVPEVGTCQY